MLQNNAGCVVIFLRVDCRVGCWNRGAPIFMCNLHSRLCSWWCSVDIGVSRLVVGVGSCSRTLLSALGLGSYTAMYFCGVVKYSRLFHGVRESNVQRVSLPTVISSGPGLQTYLGQPLNSGLKHRERAVNFVSRCCHWARLRPQTGCRRTSVLLCDCRVGHLRSVGNAVEHQLQVLLHLLIPSKRWIMIRS